MSELGSTNPSEQYNPEDLIGEAEQIVLDAFHRVQAHAAMLQLESDPASGNTDEAAFAELVQSFDDMEAEMQQQEVAEELAEKPKAGILVAGVACVAGFAINCLLDSFLGKNKKNR